MRATPAWAPLLLPNLAITHTSPICVKIAHAQADELQVWLCQDCLNVTALAQAVDDHQEPAKPAPGNIVEDLTDLKASTPLHIPRRYCHPVATDLAAHIHSAIQEPTVATWYRLLSYAYKGLYASATISNNSSKPMAHDSDAPEHPLNQQSLSDRALTRGIRNKCTDRGVS
ncbi:hypothetical protein Pmani_012824 [Petrolisthes manimaculis]|uniref:Uncharacterized protein n=1 Tax=Petrolisthes manimaculis TaxID=1843537 RepID=A0AAE1UE91_9EUCA|nr:hypothetical protein Pmani_012824 [Petrolisthes manimaculis]